MNYAFHPVAPLQIRHTFRGVPISVHPLSSTRRLSPHTPVSRRPRRLHRPQAYMTALPNLPHTVHTFTSLLVADDDLTRQIFVGGIGIILSGVIGVIVVSILISLNYEKLNEEWQDRDPNGW